MIFVLNLLDLSSVATC